MRQTSSLGSWQARFAAFGAMALVASLGSVTSSCNLDPVHRAGVNNLGPEDGDSYPPESEFHRPGEPCALCHSKSGPADSQFVLAGTIFWGPDRYDRRVDQAYVRVLDANKVKKCFVTNCNGNFFVTPDQFTRITFPLLISVERTKDPGHDENTMVIRRMTGHIGRESSCATCHILGLRDFGSPGQIRMFDDETQVDQANVPLPECPKPPEAEIVTQCPEDRL
jgi:hypothetical protein